MKRLKSDTGKSISGGIIRSLLSSTFLAGLGIFLIISTQQVYTYYKLSKQLYQKELNTTNAFVKGLVTRNVNFIERRRLEIDRLQEDEIRHNVEEIASVAQLIYDTNKATKSKQEIRGMILRILSTLRSSNSLADVSIATLDGVGVLSRNKPQLEGQNLKNLIDNDVSCSVRKELDLLSKQDSGYVRLYNEKKIGEGGFESGCKVSYVKAFPSLNWYFVAKCHPNLYYQEFAGEIANKIRYDNFDYDGYSFLLEGTGKALSIHGKVYVKGREPDFSIDSYDDAKKDFLAAKESLEKSPDGIYTSLIRRDDDSTKQETYAYLVYYAPCDWIVGGSFSKQKLEESLLVHKKNLLLQITTNIIIVLLVLLVVFYLQYTYGKRFFGFIQRDFDEFQKFFQSARKNKTYVQVEKLSYTETKFMAITANDMIDELRRTLNDMLRANQKAIQSNKLKSAFLANLSHEIRTPMNAIVGFSELLSEDLSPEDRSELVELIRESGEDLLLLIENIITTAKIESGDIKITKEKVEIQSIIDAATTFARSKIKKSRNLISFSVKSSVNSNYVVFTDTKRLYIALHHLLENAVKFTPQGYIELALELENNKLFFRVSDTGIGIADDNLQVIFEHFTRVEDIDAEGSNLTRSDRGVGVGLALCKNIIDALGGEIRVESSLNEGSSFFFYILVD